MRKVAIVAFHFLPQVGSSGNLRGPEEARVAEIPTDMPVVRACGLDTRRQLSPRGWYFRWSDIRPVLTEAGADGLSSSHPVGRG